MRLKKESDWRAEAAAQGQEKFEFLRYRIDTSGPTPAACLVFSGALNSETDYSTYLEFQPRLQAAISANGRDLCVGGLSFSDQRTLTLREGLPSEDGRSLEAAETITIDFADRPAYVGFKGSGVILPRLDADGLPIETVNVDTVAIKVLRVNDRALVFKSITQGVNRAQGSYSGLYGDENPYDVSEEIWSGEMDIKSVPNAPVVSVFPINEVIGELEAGAYFVEITDARKGLESNGPPAQSRRWIITTDLALTSYVSDGGMHVTARSLLTAKAAPTTRVELVAANNEILASETANSDGAVQFDAALTRGTGGMRPKMIMAYGKSGDFAVLDLDRSPVDLSSEPIGGRRPPFPLDAYLYTERGIYRPGETVHLTAMIRDAKGNAIEDRSSTVVVYRPNGMESHRQRFDALSLGALQMDYELPKSASRGMWRAVLNVDGMEQETGSIRFSVEDFVPQRISVELNTDEETPLELGGVREVEVESRFLYGAPGAALNVVSEARLTRDAQPFEDFKGFKFGRHDYSFSTQTLDLPDQVTDGAGKAVIPIKIGRRGQDANIPLRVQALVSVLEPGGRAVSKRVSIPYRPKSQYLAIKPDFESAPGEDDPAVFKVVSISPEGEAQAVDLDWKVIEINYDYDWYRDGDEWRWRRTRYVRTVNEGSISLDDGEVGEVSTAGLGRWGDHQIIITDKNSNDTASHSFWVGWGGYTEDGVDAPDRVRVTASEQAPNIGGQTVVSIQPPYDGQAQIVVATETVEKILYRDVSAEGTQVTIPVTESWGNGAYVMVTVFTPRDPTFNAKPRRAVGVSYVPVNTEPRIFDVSFEAPEVARPRTEQKLTVNFENGPREPVYLTLAAVDEGILALTDYKTPDPAKHFFGKKALGVSLYDDYGRLLDPNLAAPGEVRSGGDSLGGEGLSVVPTKTVSLFSGLISANRSGKAEISFDMPDFNGEVRLMAVVWSKSGMGSGEQGMIIRDPVPTELSLPRFLAPGDTAIATASIDNVELGAGTFTADIASTAGVSALNANLQETLQTGARVDREVTLAAQEEGINTLTLSVDGPEGFEVDRPYQIQTRSAFLPVTTLSRELMSKGDMYSVSSDLIASFVPGSSEVAVSFSPLPIDAGSLYASLSRYPYGCSEQTVSRALPLLYAEELAKLAKKDTGGEAASARMRVQEAVGTLLNRQSPDGSFGLWREGDRNASPWIGAYVVDFLYRAKEAGYTVPDAALSRAYQALANVGQGEAWRVYGYETDVYESRWHNDTQEKLMQRSAPYALYVLAKAGQADVSRLRYIHDRELSSIRSPMAKAHLGAALSQMGDRSRANSAFRSAMRDLGYNNNGDYYQTPLRDLAGVLTLAAEAGMDDLLAELSLRLAADIPEPEQLMTQEKVFLLTATHALTKGQPKPEIEVDGMEGDGDRYLLDEGLVRTGVSFTNAADAPIWRTTLATGAPSSAPPADASDLRVSKQIYSVSGGRVDLANVSQGDRLVIHLMLDPEQRRRNPLIVADLLPAGFEIEAVLRPSDAGEDGAFSWLDELSYSNVAEARDDRFIAAIDVFDDEETLAYVVRAVTPGTFTIPGVVAEDMYRPTVFARSEAGTVTITAR